MRRELNSKIIQNFLGEIEGVNFDIEVIFKTTENILNYLVENFKDFKISSYFVEDLKWSIIEVWNSTNIPSEIIENDLKTSIDKANSFKELSFEVYGSTDFFEEIKIFKLKNIKKKEEISFFFSLIFYVFVLQSKNSLLIISFLNPRIFSNKS